MGESAVVDKDPASGKASMEAGGSDDATKAGDGVEHMDKEELVQKGLIAEVTYKDIFKRFVLLGWTAFGGPAAHIAIFQKLFVENLKWMSLGVFTELLALGQCLPGPTSTQMSFAIGVVSKGIPGGLLSGILFQYPGLIIMTVVGAGAAEFLASPDAWLRAMAQGFGATGVALVAGAAVSLAMKLCPTIDLRALCAISAVLAFYMPEPWMFPSLIAFGGLVTLYVNRKKDMRRADAEGDVTSLGLGMWSGGALILVWLAVLVSVIVARSQTDYDDDHIKPLHWFEAFYRIGSLIFGGGQVVLPMLIDEVVQDDCPLQPDGTNDCPDSWVSTEQFLAGLGLAQAMPGPLFNLSAYLGAVMAIRAGMPFIAGVAVCWIGLFGPGLMLIYGVLPFWGKFRSQPVYRRALPGLNASAVGLVVAAVFSLFLKIYLNDLMDWKKASVCIMIISFASVEYLKVPAPLMVLGGGVLGLIAHYGGLE
ncbi:unnamed protein product [Pedinophyceae sp. YPF-701]|nr:unnamed protein product [Pedinophyceae sp. YPF-701]